MSKERLARMTALIKEEQEKKDNKGKKTGGENATASAIYQFWNAPIGSKVTIRFTPDGDQTNPWMYVTQQTIELPFAGQVGGNYATDEEVTATVPCMDMFKERSCPIIAATRSWWNKGSGKEDLARVYWKKYTYFYQGFVVNSPIEEKLVPENPIRRFNLTNSLHKLITESLKEPEFEDAPDDYVGGTDFIIKRTKLGENANYLTSTWARNPRALNEAENIAIQTYGLFNLSDFLPKRPDADGIALIKAMFEDSVAGKPFDFDSYGHLYRAFKNRKDSDNDSANRPTAKPAVASPTASRTVVEQSAPETVETKPIVSSGDASPAAAAILARIRKNTQSA